MYSRNTSGGNGYRFPRNTVKEEGMHRHLPNVPAELSERKEIDKKDTGVFEKVNTNTVFPEPPLNYGGTIYDSLNIGKQYGSVNAEGIDRMVKNDESYYEFEKKIRRREYRQRMRREQQYRKEQLRRDDTDITKRGIGNIINGLRQSSFSPEDILICAMILLMLNSSSEDDMMMVLVLLMLL